jgi:hypothetical protein
VYQRRGHCGAILWKIKKKVKTSNDDHVILASGVVVLATGLLKKVEEMAKSGDMPYFFVEKR